MRAFQGTESKENAKALLCPLVLSRLDCLDGTMYFCFTLSVKVASGRELFKVIDLQISFVLYFI